jgi:acetoin utilization protein AcuB
MAPIVRDYMTHAPHTIEASEPLATADRQMRAHGIRHLPVLENGALVGIVTARDIHMLTCFKQVDALKTSVRDAMTRAPFTVAPAAPLEDVAHAMAMHKHGSAIVTESGRVVGIFTSVDALRALVDALHRAPTSNRWGHLVEGR